MTDPDLQKSLTGLRPPAPSAQARDRALHRATIALANPAPDAPTPRRHPWSLLPLATLGSACALLFCGWLLLRAPNAPTTTAQSSTADRDLLTQTGQLFPGQLNAIVINNGTPQLDLYADATTQPAPADQAILVELTRDHHTLRILSYSGRTIRVQLNGADLHLVPLLTAAGDILLSGDDFVWSRDTPAQIAGWNVSTHPLL